MKRLIIRIAALGTVVALGLIAIAQAQRGSKDSTPPPAQSQTNPLRSEVIPAGLGAEFAAPREKPSTDPFAGRLGSAAPVGSPGVGEAVPAADRSLEPKEVQIPATQLPSAQFPVEDGQHAHALGGSGSAEALSVASAGDSVGPLPLGRSSESYPSSSSPREPARFRAEPGAVPAGVFGSSAATAPSDFPAPNTLLRNNFSRPPATTIAVEESPPASEGVGQPGGKQLDGPQCPNLTIEKFAPEKIQVGKPAVFKVTVCNSGKIAAGDVVIRDQLPKGTRLIGTTPRASLGAKGEMTWELGALRPGEQSSVEVELMPIAEGEIGSVATVQFSAAASVRCISTKPQLVLKTSTPRQVLIGEEVTLSIEVSNPGSGTATGVVLEEHIPAGLQHSGGTDLEYEVGDLPSGESRKLELTLVAKQAGSLVNLLIARGDGNLRSEDRTNLEIIAPKLDISVAGPKRRYLEREAAYRLSVHNPGTAPAKQVELTAYLPTGLEFVSANNAGHYQEANHAVCWRLEELPTNETGTVELVTMPVAAGEQSIRLRGTAEKGLTVEKQQPVVIEGIAAILFQAADVTDPIEVGGETTYEIRVLNQGSKTATNIRVAVMLPAELRPLSAEGPARHNIQGNRVLFDGLSRLAPKADTTYRVRVQALRPGDMRTRVQLLTDDIQTPITKEESTRVYSDE